MYGLMPHTNTRNRSSGSSWVNTETRPGSSANVYWYGAPVAVNAITPSMKTPSLAAVRSATESLGVPFISLSTAWLGLLVLFRASFRLSQFRGAFGHTFDEAAPMEAPSVQMVVSFFGAAFLTCTAIVSATMKGTESDRGAESNG